MSDRRQIQSFAREYEPLSRWKATARTWVSKTVWRFHACKEAATDDGQRDLLAYDAWWLFTYVISDMHMLIGAMDEERLDEAEQNTRDLLADIRRLRLAFKLTNVEGRTPEEAAAFRAKAQELGDRR